MNQSIDISVSIPRFHHAPEPEFGEHTVLIPGELFVEFAEYRLLSLSPWAYEYEFIGVKELEIFQGACDDYKAIHTDWITNANSGEKPLPFFQLTLTGF